jgi:hypothetical protein
MLLMPKMNMPMNLRHLFLPVPLMLVMRQRQLLRRHHQRFDKLHCLMNRYHLQNPVTLLDCRQRLFLQLEYHHRHLIRQFRH